MKKYIIEPGDFFNKRNTPKGFVSNCSHSGDCQSDVEGYLNRFEVPNKEYLISYLKEFGAWDSEELSDHNMNVVRLLWIMAGDIMDSKEFVYSH